MSNLTVVKKVENAVLYTDSSGGRVIRLDNVRLSYPFLGTPSEDESDDGDKKLSWRVQGMLPKATHVAAKDICKEVIQKLCATNEVKIPQAQWFLSNGDDKEAEEMHGHFLVSASDMKVRPRCRDRKGVVIDDIAKIDDLFYGGCWGSILIRPWYFNGKRKNSAKIYPKRIVAGLNSVMFLRDDKPFGQGRIDDSECWDDLASGDDGYDSGGFDDDDGL
ncbi:MAG: DUF2815 family protein [Chromatiales bacterium]|nr:DUF2815 family protein [Chromatiales bacterium]